MSRTTSALYRHAISHDASHFRLIPAEVATPATLADVAALCAEARRSRRTMTFRSGGTSLSGQAVSDDLLVDTRKNFRGIEVRDDGATVKVGVGTTLRAVNAALRPYGRRLGPDPASEVACTIGGVLANNSSGMLCGTQANAYSTLEALTFVLPSGHVIDTSAPDADIQLRLHEPTLVHGLLTLRRRVLDNPKSVAEIRRQFAMKNTMGYSLNSFLDFERPIDLARHLLVGSEGTLGFVADATFRTVALLEHRATGLAIFDSLDAAAAAVPTLVEAGFDAIELMDATALRVAQALTQAPQALLDLDVDDHTALLVEVSAPTSAALAQRLTQVASVQVATTQPLQLSVDQNERARLWSARKGLYAAVAANRPQGTSALLEDVAVPVTALAEVTRKLTTLLTTHGYDASVIFGHARDGNLHFMLCEDFDNPNKLSRYRRFTRDLVKLVLGAGGTLKAEHGTGRTMAPFVAAQYGDELYEVMREVKGLFDPDAILNPGVILTTDSQAHTRHLKRPRRVDPEVDDCVECGYCEPVCPSRDLTLTPRQRIVLRREAAAHPGGELGAHLLEDDGYALIDTCAVDSMCATACPLGLNTGDLVRRLRAESHSPAAELAWNATARSWGAVTKLGSAALTTAGATGPVATAATDVARRVFGKDTVPRYDPSLPQGGRVKRRGSDAAFAVAAYFPACIQTMFGTSGLGVSQALGALADRAGIGLRQVNADGLCCGVPWKSKGHRAGYEAMRRKARRRLAGTEPSILLCDAASCTEGLAQLLTGLDDVQVVDVVEFTATHLLERLEVVSPIESIALHPTCSTRQLGLDQHLRRIAEVISDDVVVPDQWGCCGFAGDRGLLHPELTASAAAAEAAEVNGRRFAAYASANRTCEIGMSRATGHNYVHILELLELATRPARS
ncbi:MAG: FAD-binding and (Fe-S)-binding domain-containing protein [Arachnia sp.]